MMIESAMAVRFTGAANFYSSAVHRNSLTPFSFTLFTAFFTADCVTSATNDSRSTCSSDEVTNCHSTYRSPFRRGVFDLNWNRVQRVYNASPSRRVLIKHKIQATAEHSGFASDPIRKNERMDYHPFEKIGEATPNNSDDATLTVAETSRTIIEVNYKAALMFSGMINDEIRENIMWPDLPYVTDEHGNVYFQVKTDDDHLKSLAVENNFVQVVIGFDTTELMKEIDSAAVDFEIEDYDDEGSDIEDEDAEEEDYDEDWVAALEDDQDDSDGTLGEWAKVRTMRSSHPIYFAKKLTEVASDDPIDWMEQPSDGLAIEGILRPAFIEEHSEIQKHMSMNQSRSSDKHQVEKVLGEQVENLDIINSQRNELGSSVNGSLFYKLEMTKIRLITARGHQTDVELDDFKEARPDALAHSASKIISRLKSDGEKTIQALKSLCLRCKGIQVEEVAIISVDSLGFNLRVCSGTQIQTLRVAFKARATSEYSADRQLNDLLFPKSHRKPRKRKTGSSK